jgi:hypothetical protein
MDTLLRNFSNQLPGDSKEILFSPFPSPSFFVIPAISEKRLLPDFITTSSMPPAPPGFY